MKIVVLTRGKSDRKISGFGLSGLKLDRASGRVGYYPSMLHRVSGFSFRASGFYKYTYFTKKQVNFKIRPAYFNFLKKILLKYGARNSVTRIRIG